MNLLPLNLKCLLLKQKAISVVNLRNLNLIQKYYTSTCFTKDDNHTRNRKLTPVLASKLISKLKSGNRTRLFSTKFKDEKIVFESEVEDKTHFGNEILTKEEKAQKVHHVFENVAAKYDLMNDVMSAGIHRIWKDIFVARLSPTAGIKVLDVAGGTGDITFRIVQHVKNQLKQDGIPDPSALSSRLAGFREDIYDAHHSAPETAKQETCKVTVCDISESMLSVGQERAARSGHRGIDWVCGDAQNLPFPDGVFDAYTIAYGMRNVVDVEKALREAYRVLKPGGRFLCLEFSRVRNSVVRSVYDLYSWQLIPVMGQVIASDWDSYQYLVESIRKFPDQETYQRMIQDSGFRRVSFQNLTFGVTAIHSGFKI